MVNTREIAAEYRLSHWAQIMKERNEKGLSIKEFCEQQGIAENTYFYWQRKLREAACQQMNPTEKEDGTKTAIVPQGLAACSMSRPLLPSGWAVCTSAKGIQGNSGISIEIGNSRISVSADVDLEFLAKVCRMVTALC